MLFEKLSFQEQNYGMKGIQLATSGRLNSLDKILLVVLFLLIIVVFVVFFCPFVLFCVLDLSTKRVEKATAMVNL